MKIDVINEITHRLQKDTVGDPSWNSAKHVFEFTDKSIEVVVILKIVRAVHAINAMNHLCKNGLFIDMCAIWRCLNDSCIEVYFLLEKYPDKSSNVEKFINEFFSKTIDNYLETDKEPVPNKKILNAYIRIVTGQEQNEEIKQAAIRVYKTNSGYIHASYAHIMEMFGGSKKHSFNLAGIQSKQQISMREEIVEVACVTILQSIMFVAQKFNLASIYGEAKKAC